MLWWLQPQTLLTMLVLVLAVVEEVCNKIHKIWHPQCWWEEAEDETIVRHG